MSQTSASSAGSRRYHYARADVFPVPDLAVKVLSPSTAHEDRGIQKRDYAAHGVAEYWIVDPVARSVEVYLLRGQDYEPAVTRQGDAELASTTLAGFWVPIHALFDQSARVTTLTALLA